ncbi:MAG: hypothetical protein AAGD10_08555 [Myxococcota bacterium]
MADDPKGPAGPDRDVLIPAPRSMGSAAELESVGPWSVLRRLLRAPGVDLYEAEQGKTRALLQVVDLRPARPHEDEARVKFTQSVQQLTAASTPDPDAELLDHGVSERAQGGSALYWALPWEADAALLAASGPELEAADELVILAHDLLERLVRRHEKKRRDPLLSEALIATQGERGVHLMGFPIVVDPRWSDDEMTPPRFARPEIRPEGPLARPEGDLFRLGRCLEEIGHRLESVPEPLVEMIRRFQKPPAGEGYGSAREAIEWLEEKDATGQLGVRSKTLSRPRIASAQTIVETRGPGLDVEMLRESTPWTTADHTLDDPEVVDQPDEKTQATVAPAKTQIVPSPQGRDSEKTIRVKRSSPPEDAETRVEAPSDGPLDKTETGVPGLVPRPSGAPNDGGPEGTIVGVRVPTRNELARPLAPGGSPVPEPRRRAQYPAALPQPIPPSPRSLPATTGPYPNVLPGAVPPGAGGTSDEEDEELPDVTMSSRAPLYIALGLFLTGLSTFVASEFLGPQPTEDERTRERAEVQMLRPPLDVWVKVKPENASLYSSEDGTFLGAGQARIMTGSELPKLVAAAPGYVPAQIPLPQRGTVSVELTRVEEETACSVEIRRPAGVQLSPVAGSAERSSNADGDEIWSFRGAALLVAEVGRGAWVVDCPSPGATPRLSLPRRSPATEVELEVTWPTRGEIFIDGEPQGSAPLKRTVPNRFVSLRAETPDGEVERWIPAFRNSQIELPDP